MGAIANRLGIRITDGCLFPYTALTERQQDMRPWHGPMEKEWLVDTREARAKRLKYIEGERSGIPRVADRNNFSIATAEKEELLEYVANEFGETLDARMPILILRRQTLALQSKQLDELEAAERRANEAQQSQSPVQAEPAVEVIEADKAEAKVAPRGLGRRAA